MLRAVRTSIGNMDAILQLLERRRLHNAWLIWFAWDALHDPDHSGEVVICRSGSQLLGAAYLGQRPLRDEKAPADFDVHMDAVSADAARALTEALCPGAIGHFQLFTPETRQFFDGLEDAKRHEDDLYYTVSAEHFRPVGRPDVVEMTEAEAGLFEGCERQPDWAHAHEESRLFAIVLDESVAASVCCTPITPNGATAPRVVSIGALHTETPHRRQGLGRRMAPTPPS